MSPIWRNRLIAIAVVIAALVGAFSAGRFSAPLQVKTVETVRTEYKDRIVDRVVTVEAAAKVETRIVWRDRVITRDGTVTEHEIEKTGTREDTSKTTDAAHVATRENETATVKESTTTLRPDWRVSVLAGASLRAPLVPIAGPLVIGVEVDRRIVGGVSAGVWVSTVGAAGLAVSVEF